MGKSILVPTHFGVEAVAEVEEVLVDLVAEAVEVEDHQEVGKKSGTKKSPSGNFFVFPILRVGIGQTV